MNLLLELERVGRRGPTGRNPGSPDPRALGGDKRNVCDRTDVYLNQDCCWTIQARPRGTQPGAEHSAVRRRLMLGMVLRMFEGSCLRQSTNSEDTQH
jgi:hypothetical protein